MVDPERKLRFEKARERARQRRFDDVPYEKMITAVYESVRGEEPWSSSQADADGMRALVAHLKEELGNDRTGSPLLPESLAGSLRSEFMKSSSLFNVARMLIDGFPEPLGDGRHVWVSSGGQVYHRYNDCQGLIEGRAKAGREPSSGLSTVTVREARLRSGYHVSERRPCKVCIP